MKFTKGALSLLLAGSLALGACGKVQQAPTATAPEPQAAEPIDPTVSRYGDPTKASTSPMHDALAATITDAANNTVIEGRAYFNLYSATEWPSKADSFPTTFDLRNRGVIAPVKSQNPWGTCWSFAAIRLFALPLTRRRLVSPPLWHYPRFLLSVLRLKGRFQPCC
jgi:hypothetical protein